MPNNSYTHTNLRLEKRYSLVFVSGASGAVPATFVRGKGIKSVTRNSAGKYTIVVTRNGSDLIDFDAFVEQASFSLSGAVWGCLISQNVATAGGGIVVQFVTAAGAAVDPTTGDTVKVNFNIKHSAGLL